MAGERDSHQAVGVVPVDMRAPTLPRPESIFRLEIPRHTRFISVAREAADAAAQDLGFSYADRAAIRLAVGEACNNAVLHGAGREMMHQVCVTCRCGVDGAIEFDIANPGALAPVPLDTVMPGPEAEHGRGIPLIKSLMDSVEVFGSASGTTVRLRKCPAGGDVSAPDKV